MYPPGKGHGVDDRTVKHAKSNWSFANLPVDPRAPEVAGCKNVVADLDDIACYFGIAVNTEQSGDFLTSLLADLGFLLPGEAEKAPFSGSGNDIGYAAVKEQGAEEKR